MINNVMHRMIEYFSDDVRRINHALKVYGFTSLIAEEEKLSKDKKRIVCYAALLHDIGIKEAERKYGSSNGSYQEIEGPPIAKEIMSDLKINDTIIERVCFIIGRHHTLKAIDGMDFQILVEADFLVNIFEDGMEQNSVESVYTKVFKTNTGKNLLKRMYLK